MEHMMVSLVADLEWDGNKKPASCDAGFW